MTSPHADTLRLDSAGPVSCAAFTSLVSHRHEPVVTISLPLDPARPQPVGDRIALKVLAQRAADLLHARPDVTPAAARALLGLVDEVLDRERVDVAGARGLVLATSPGLRAELAVPTDVHPGVHVGGLVHVLPLVPARRVGERYAVLCLSEASVEYFEGDRFALHAREVADLPRSLDEALWYEDHHERHLGLHQSMPRGNRLVATMHGGGAARDAHHDRLRRFLRQVDYAVAAHLGTVEPLPLVVVGVEDVVDRFAANSHFPWVVTLPVGNVAHRPVVELHDATWPTARRHLRQPLDRALAAAAELRGTGLVVDHPDDVAEAALEGQVAQLLIADTWCTPPVPFARGQEPDGAERANAAVVHTIRHRGAVGLVGAHEVGPSGMLARLRY